MSKDNRNIVRAPRIHGRMVTDEDEIEQLLSPAQGEKLLESGALAGDWDFDGDGEEPVNEQKSDTRNALIESLENQLKSVDSVLKGRDALEDLPTREDKILKAIRIASEGEKAQSSLNGALRRIESLETENANVRRELQEAGDNSQETLKKAQVELDTEKAEVARLTSENETLKADLEKSQKPKTPAK